jgi:hypothetical protein
MQLQIGPSRRFAVILIAAVAFIAACSTMAQFHKVDLAPQAASSPAEKPTANIVEKTLIKLFDPDGEANVAAWFAGLEWLMATLLLGLIALHHFQNAKPYAWRWLLLAAAFLWLSMDEIAMFHEKLEGVVRRAASIHNFRGPMWLIPAALCIGLLGWAIFRLFLSLPKGIRVRWVASAVIFLTGTIGFEALGSYFDAHYHHISWLYNTSTCIEEAMENLGVAIFVLSLAKYIGEEALGVATLGKIVKPAEPADPKPPV